VSPLPNRRVRLQITAAGLTATLCARWPRPKALATCERPWASAPRESGASSWDLPPGFAATLDGVLQELAAAERLRGALLDIELADSMVHFDVAMGEFAGYGEAQLDGVSRACLRDLLDDAGDAHEIRWQLQADERHLLICAVPQALLAELRQGAARTGLRLQRLQPQFPLRWNRHRRLLGSGLGVFASGHGDHTVIAFVRRGVVEALGVGNIGAGIDDAQAPAPMQLDAQVDRLIASLGVDASQLGCFVAVDDGEPGAPLAPRWTFCNGEGVRA
jgi:hypothetical protein